MHVLYRTLFMAVLIVNKKNVKKIIIVHDIIRVNKVTLKLLPYIILEIDYWENIYIYLIIIRWWWWWRW